MSFLYAIGGAFCIACSAVGAYCMFSKKNSDQQHDNEEETSETTAFLQQAPESQQSQNPLDKIVNNNSNSNIEIISYKSEGSNQQQEQQQAHVTIDISERLKLFKDKAKPLPDLVSKKTKGKSALVSNRRKRTKMSPRDAISQVEADATLTRAI